MSTVNRYNAFIPEPGKPGFVSCPTCYRLTKGSGQQATCSHCALTAPILVNPGAVVVPSALQTKMFIIAAIGTGSMAANHIYRCPHCGSNFYSGLGLYAVGCTICGKSGPVSYANICNACLLAPTPKFVAATYLCSNPKANHTVGHNSGLTEAGKCATHACSVSCKKI